jgi:hypothetical protein
MAMRRTTVKAGRADGGGSREPTGPRSGRSAARGRTAARVLALVAAVALLALGGAPQALAAQPKTGLVRGVVVLGPFVPVSRGSAPAWPPEKAVVKIFRHGRTEALRTLRTGADGLFAVRLPAGSYRFTAEPAGPSTLPVPHDVRLRLRAGQSRHVRLWLDTGVRFPDATESGQTVGATDPPGGDQKYRQGVLGTTRRGPIVPTVRPGEPSDEPCDATLAFYRLDGRVAARPQSTKEAGFSVALPAATYIVDAGSAVSGFDRAGPFTLHVPKGQWQSLTVNFDTGIRFIGTSTSPADRVAHAGAGSRP